MVQSASWWCPPNLSLPTSWHLSLPGTVVRALLSSGMCPGTARGAKLKEHRSHAWCRAILPSVLLPPRVASGEDRNGTGTGMAQAERCVPAPCAATLQPRPRGSRGIPFPQGWCAARIRPGRLLTVDECLQEAERGSSKKLRLSLPKRNKIPDGRGGGRHQTTSQCQLLEGSFHL